MKKNTIIDSLIIHLTLIGTLALGFAWIYMGSFFLGNNLQESSSFTRIFFGFGIMSGGVVIAQIPFSLFLEELELFQLFIRERRGKSNG